MMGLSLGSAIASTFAYKYPQATDKLIVAGIVMANEFNSESPSEPEADAPNTVS